VRRLVGKKWGQAWRRRQPAHRLFAQGAIPAFATYVAGVLGVLVGGGLLASSVLGHVSFGWLHDVAADVQARRRYGRAGPQRRRQCAGRGGRLPCLGSGKRALKREVAMARSRAVQMQAVQDENRRLKAQLNLAPGDPTPANG
jgi:rod shape-determining protein MreC